MKNVFRAIEHILGMEGMIYYENEDAPGKTLIGDNRLLREALHFDAFTPLDDGIKKAVWWMKEQFDKQPL